MLSNYVEIVNAEGKTMYGTIPRDDKPIATIRTQLERLNPGAISITILEDPTLLSSCNPFSEPKL